MSGSHTMPQKPRQREAELPRPGSSPPFRRPRHAARPRWDVREGRRLDHCVCDDDPSIFSCSPSALQKAVNSPAGLALLAFSSMNVKSDWFRSALPSCGFDAPLLKADSIAVTGDTTRGSEWDISLAVGLKRGIGQVGRRRRTGHVGLLEKVGLRRRRIRALRVQRRTAKCAWPLRVEQHVVFPDAVLQHALEDLVHILGRIGQRRFADDLALERLIASEPQRELGSGSQGRGGVAFTTGQRSPQSALKKLYGPLSLLAATSSLSGTFLICSNEVKIHWDGSRSYAPRESRPGPKFGQALSLCLRVGRRRFNPGPVPCGSSWPASGGATGSSMRPEHEGAKRLVRDSGRRESRSRDRHWLLVRLW